MMPLDSFQGLRVSDRRDVFHPSDAPKQSKEVDAKDYAKTVTQCMDHYQACKIKEAKMIKDLKRLQEIKRELKRRILKGI